VHLLARQIGTLNETAEAVDLQQTPAECVFLSFSDSDLAALAAVHAGLPGERPSLRLANLSDLKHPFSVDLYIEKVIARARFVIVRLLGGADYWRYGVDELAAAARVRGFDLAIVPGDARKDARLDEASTLPAADLHRIWAWLQDGGPENIRSLVGFVSTRLRRASQWREPIAIPAGGRYEAACRPASPDTPRALILLYRSVYLAAGTAPVDALAEALSGRGFSVETLFVTSLKDAAAAEVVANAIGDYRPDIILNTTAFSARLDEGATVLDCADAPVLQVALATSSRRAWTESRRGLSAADLAMNVVLPEIDGRIITRAISFKQASERSDELEFSCVRHSPDASRIEYVADLASAWVRLRRKKVSERRIALVLSDYPAKGGRVGYAVGLDTPASVGVIARALRSVGYDIGDLPQGDALLRALERDEALVELRLDAYRAQFSRLPSAFRQAVSSAWGDPASDDAVVDEVFRLRVFRAGNLLIAVQPDRGRRDARKREYHDANLPPRHSYVAFYIWLREVARINALIHLGTHGTLEWLPGKAVALSQECAPEAVLGALPVIYPFIVNDPGEAAQAKRRIAAVTIGHMTPPLTDAGLCGDAREFEALLDEYAQAQELDPRRARRLADAIVARARESGLAAESGVSASDDVPGALARLDAWICDLKEMRIGDGLHVFGRADASARTGSISADALQQCARGEIDGLLRALEGRFVPPGPAGAPSRGRLDVLPTGRNLYSIDPRAVPTRTAGEIGRQAARAFVARYIQDHGDYPRSIVLDLWASATMRTGGDDLAQAFALLGVRPLWDHASSRVSGFEVEPTAMLERPRVDVTLRISGLFRDVFPTQIALFDAAVRAIALLDEDAEMNPLAAAHRGGEAAPLRVFGAAPGAYGIDFADKIGANEWSDRAELGRDYLNASSTAYSGTHERVHAGAAFAERVRAADALLHVQDCAQIDILSGDAFAEHEGGFFAAAEALGAAPAVYHADATRPDCTVVRSLDEEIARVVRGRVANPRWIAGQMRHGYRGAAEIAEAAANLLAFAATTNAVRSHQFDLVYDATLGSDEVSAFLHDANPAAARALARTFDIARERGFWMTRRNSVAMQLADAAALP
jgi:cobaltochelatase CobN